MVNRAFYIAEVVQFVSEPVASIVGKITQHHSQDLVHQQTGAWIKQIEILQNALRAYKEGMLLFEVQIPRMGRRADAVLLYKDILFVLEFKVGSKLYTAQDLRQTHGYAIDLHHFHEGSHNKIIVPILVATEAVAVAPCLSTVVDGVYAPIRTNSKNLQQALAYCAQHIVKSPPINPHDWLSSSYKPTPTIIEAAQALYANHEVGDIARNDAGAQNLQTTSRALQDIIHHARLHHRKAICFVTGVPGAGKTLVGLNIATIKNNVDEDEHAVFLSGNGPLVDVLTEALARDAKARNPSKSKSDELRGVSAKIQNIHKFRDEYLRDKNKAPSEHVVIFDEAQRAWDVESTSKFMIQKREQESFNQSEPEFLISVMDRHADWSVIIALIGGGQEINTGEAGLQGWLDALTNHFRHWDVYLSDKLTQAEYAGREINCDLIVKRHTRSSLHLGTSMRSFRAEKLSHLVHYLVHNQPENAASCYQEFQDKYPIVVTRDLQTAKAWIRDRARANETKGLIASSGAIRLKPEGIFVKNKISAADWFLNDQEDVRSCHFLEDVATEFDIQGLELDWCLIGWDADYRYVDGRFEHWKFTGTTWKQRHHQEHKRYLENTYRVLLTRARQGMVIFIPRGEANDSTRPPMHYDETFQYLMNCGLVLLN